MGGFAEVRVGGSPHPDDIAAIRCEVQVVLEDFIFGVRIFELERTKGFDGFGFERAGLRLGKPGELHGDGGAAGDDPPFLHVLQPGAEYGERIDARMVSEKTIFRGQQDFSKHR